MTPRVTIRADGSVTVDGVVVGERVGPRAVIVEVAGRRCRWVAVEPTRAAIRAVVRAEWARHAAGSAS